MCKQNPGFPLHPTGLCLVPEEREGTVTLTETWCVFASWLQVCQTSIPFPCLFPQRRKDKQTAIISSVSVRWQKTLKTGASREYRPGDVDQRHFYCSLRHLSVSVLIILSEGVSLTFGCRESQLWSWPRDSFLKAWRQTEYYCHRLLGWFLGEKEEVSSGFTKLEFPVPAFCHDKILEMNDNKGNTTSVRQRD